MIKSLFLSLALFLSGTALGANPYIQLTVDNSYTFRGQVDDGSVNEAMQALYEMSKKRGSAGYPLFLVLDCPGGSVLDGEDLIQYAKQVKNLHTITIFGASMCAGFTESLPGKRYITENGILMFHRASIGLQGQIEDGEVETRLALFKKIVRLMEIRNAKRMSLTLDDYKAQVKDELWLHGSDAVSRKAADMVVDVRCSPELVEATEIKTVNVFMFSIKLQFSKCPLFRAPVAAEMGENAARFQLYKEEIKKMFSQGVL